MDYRREKQFNFLSYSTRQIRRPKRKGPLVGRLLFVFFFVFLLYIFLLIRVRLVEELQHCVLDVHDFTYLITLFVVEVVLIVHIEVVVPFL